MLPCQSYTLNLNSKNSLFLFVMIEQTDSPFQRNNIKSAAASASKSSSHVLHFAQG